MIASTRRPGPGIRAWGTSFGEIPESEFGSIRGRLRKNENDLTGGFVAPVCCVKGR